MGQSKWGECDIPPDTPAVWDIVTLKIWYKRVANELWISRQHVVESDSGGGERAEPPEEASWSRWALRKRYDRMQLRPAFPDRPVVVKPEYPFWITEKSKAKIYVRVPIWVRIEVSKSKPIVITQIPSVILSNTWFGSVTEGELCYWISTSARLAINEDLTRPYLVICPVQIINDANQELLIEKLCLRGAGLSLYDHNGQLWSDETVARYKGPNDITEIRATGKIPAEASDATRLSAPAEAFSKGFRALTFSTLKDLPGMGFLTK